MPLIKNKPSVQVSFQLVKKELKLVESQILDQVKAFDPALEPYMDYICNTSGKRIRPALAILAGGATGGVNDDHLKIGVILELIHMSTLVHDDIIDGADTRRKVPTANAKWGNGMAVLLGDALFSHSLLLATEFDSIDICRKVGKASREVCQGEVIQTQRRFDLTLTKDDYFHIIEMKTGALFAAATGIAASLSEVSEDVETQLYNYGMKLGTAYQIYDDCLDLVGTEEEVGKTLRTDLEKGKLTLPLLNLIEQATPAQREKLNKRIIEQQPLDLPVLIGIAEYEGAVESALDTAANLLQEAREDLQILPASKWRSSLEEITSYLDGLLDKCRK
ncbi:polyprenyl synthetase family protein [Verrucomicrobiaceae bacterium N1E253]|uniref:Polyprenyl synthetase family protein n=1 Tax=Oceaniferula marina TaxID=2748318 RepID=A0A851GB13_9BACT|nr:polyprenyl synthetase family protein [Oceaniferula marina]NWK54606.1 polyprenyl synthetase family protein [Oceaniferula marina]